jgi:hypothetical protein
MGWFSLRKLVFADEIAELKRLADPKGCSSDAVLRVFFFSLLVFFSALSIDKDPDASAFLFAACYIALPVYLILSLVIHSPSIYRIVFLPLSFLWKIATHRARRTDDQLAGAKKEAVLCDVKLVNRLLLETTPKLEKSVWREIETESNFDRVLRAPLSHVFSAGVGFLIASLQSFFILAPVLFSHDKVFTLAAFGGVILSLYPLNRLIGWLLQVEQRLREDRLSALQSHMDALAARIARVTDATTQQSVGKDHSFGLYLRPFFSTGKIRVNLLRDASMDWDFETLFAYSLKGYLPIIALGQPGEHLGAGRIETQDDDWQALASDLIERADCIYIIPSNRPGTLWEMKYLKENHLLDKTIFIMPPEARIAGNEGLFSSHWDVTKVSASEFGICLPKYDSQGMLFALTDDGTSVTVKAPIQVLFAAPSDSGRRDDRSEDARIEEEASEGNELPIWLTILVGSTASQGGDGDSGESNDSWGGGD